MDDSISYKYAYLNAVDNISRQVKVHIRSRFADHGSGGRLRSIDFVKEEMDSLVFSRILKNAHIIEKLITMNTAYMLIGINNDLSSGEVTYSIKQSYWPKSKNPPDWISSAPVKRGFIYGIGMGDPYNEEGRSWDESAKQARLEVAKELNLKLDKLLIDEMNNHFTSTSYWYEEEVGITLEGCRIKDRWYDTDNQIFYTLVEKKK